ncbi:amyloid-like protein 1 isoform X2 [Clupea harengus]|uniref:Amyloid-like protein 1 isoform X2 n=1 Tax=Clupea harengus TaxID=7950 RepID=A0A6P8G0M6_CLUHA|nr:amyloid-like protein 1 isoform X2 [Clupea harengus]
MSPILLILLFHRIRANDEPQTTDDAQGPGLLTVEPQIAMFCGRPLLHMNQANGRWESDPQGRQECFTEPSQILSYCQEMYPNLHITDVKESSSPVTIPFWCKKGWGHCQTRPFIVTPYRCQVGDYVSEALLVPDRCRFLHQEQMDTCKSYVYWHSVAKKTCTEDSLELHSYGMLLPCGNHFRGVEYVCCPGRAGANGQEGVERDGPFKSGGLTETSYSVTVTRSPTTLSPMANLHESAEDEEPDDRQKELWKKEEGAGTDEEDGATASKEANAYEYSVDSVPYQASDYIENFYFEKGTQVGHNPLTPLPQTQENTLATLRSTDGVDVYFEMPGDDSEHANFLCAKMDLEERRMKRINEIMKEWAEADNQSKDLPKSERQALNEHFQSVLQTLEEQVAGERRRLVETHLARVVASLNSNRRLALKNYLAAVQSENPQPESVLQALKHYMAAEQRDRKHTLSHYQHIEAVDPQRAKQMKFKVYTHLHVIEERVNQSLALLHRVPTLVEELHQEIDELVKSEHEDISELMTISYSETHTTEEMLTAEGAEENDTDEEEEHAFQSRPYPLKFVSGTKENNSPTSERGALDEDDEKIDVSVEVTQMLYKSSGIQRDELQPDALETFNRGAMVGLLVIAVAIAMVMVISLLLVRRKPYGTISHGIVEVDPMLTPEEGQLNKMQNHGYENPTYTFFEQMN